MARFLIPKQHKAFCEDLKKHNVAAADIAASQAAQEERLRRSLKANSKIPEIVKSGVERGDSFDKIYRYCSVLKNHLGYDPKNYVKKLYDSYREAENDGHEDR